MIKNERVDVGGAIENLHVPHFENICAAARAGNAKMVQCDPKLGSAALVTVQLGSEGYRQGKVFHFDPSTLSAADGSAASTSRWEAMYEQRCSADGWYGG